MPAQRMKTSLSLSKSQRRSFTVTHVQDAERNAYEKHLSDRIDLMLETMNSDLQKQYDLLTVPKRGSYKRWILLDYYSIVRRISYFVSNDISSSGHQINTSQLKREEGVAYLDGPWRLIQYPTWMEEEVMYHGGGDFHYHSLFPLDPAS
ncbi:hypothetical protein F2Q70_00044974 [Brassica cretica]|uniref:Uncharacterized protein n=1 Tax=Brassica cretica TaxID=69181 RepID=A0A8S9KLT8_BRACR|nr:hypothetical protein F2Q70_00044974 [Brassica cretica]